jgi:hypothetical protein
MAVNQEVVITFNAETGELLRATKAVEDSVDDVGKAAKKSGSDLSDMGETGSSAFKSIGTALKATGIGLLVGLLAKLAMKFAENKKVADTLAVAGAALGTVFNDIVNLGIRLGETVASAFTDPKQAVIDLKDAIVENITNRITGLLNLLPSLGEAIELVFSGKFKEAGKVALDAAAQATLGVTDFTDKIGEATTAVVEYATKTATAVSAATSLEKELQKVSDAERDLAVRTAQSRAEVEELKRQRDDETLSIEERAAAAERAAAIDQEIADENVRLAEEKAELLRREIELQGETEERLQAVADAEIAAADARGASAAVQTELQNSIFALNAERKQNAEAAAEAERKAAEDELAARQKLEDELYALTLSAREREELALMQKYDERVAIAGDDEGLLQAATEQLNADLAAIDEKYRAESDAQGDAQRQAELDKELANAEAIKQARLNITKSTLNALSALNEAFTGESEQEQKKGFERSKKIQTAQALISTYESAVQAFKSLAGIPVVGPGLGTAAAAAATAAGLANVKKIQSQTFQGGVGGDDSSYSGTGGAASAATAAGITPPAPTLDLGFLGEGAQQQVIETYVISENVTSAQQANKKIQDQSTL